MTVLRFRSGRHYNPGGGGDPPPVTSDATFQIKTTQNLFLHDDDAVQSALNSWLDTVDETNKISLTVTGDVKAKAWGWYREHTSGQTKDYVHRNFRRFIRASTTGSTEGNTAFWTLSSHTGPNGTGSPTTFTIVFDINNDPRLTIDISSRAYAGQGGFKISWLNRPEEAALSNDWTITAQSTANAFAIWFNPTTFVPYSIAWANADGASSSYLGAKGVTAPVLGDGAYWVDVTSAVRGVTRRITFNVRDDILDAIDFPGRDSESTSPYSQYLKYLISGSAADAVHSSGILYWGDEFIIDGLVSPETSGHNLTPKQPQQRVGGPARPLCPYGANADVDDPMVGWHPNYGINPGFMKTRSRYYLNGRIARFGINVQNLTDFFGGYCWYGISLYKGASASNVSIRIYDNSGSTNGTHGFMFSHCVGATIGTEENDYNTMWVVENCIFDRSEYPTVGNLGVKAQDSIIWGNIFNHYNDDIADSHLWCSTVGNGRSKRCFNYSINKQLEKGLHSDFAQPQVSSTTSFYGSQPANAEVDLGYWVGDACLKIKGRLLTAADIANSWGSAGDEGKTTSDCQGIFTNTAQLPPIGQSQWRSDIQHTVKFAGYIHEGAAGKGVIFPPRSPNCWYVNSLVMWPYSVVAQTGVPGAYYEKGFWAPGINTIMPSYFLYDRTDVTVSVDGAHSVRNVPIHHPGTVPAGMIGDNYGTAYFPDADELTIPANLAACFVNPTGLADCEDIRELIACLTLTSNSPLKAANRFTTEDFGPINSMIDHERQTFDPTRLFSY